MKDFDETRHAVDDRDRRFKIGGVEFDVQPRPIPADLLAKYFDAIGQPDDQPGINAAVLAAADEIVDHAIVVTDRAKWDDVRSVDHDDPLTIRDVQGVVTHIIEVTAARPIVQPSGSGSGSRRAGTSSTDTSPSEERS